MIDRLFGTFMALAGLALGIGPWITAGPPSDALEWSACALLTAFAALCIAIGANVWRDSE